MRIGLLGGSFNPAHNGHRLISLIALRRLQLDAVWWLVSPGNPLKDNRALPPLKSRLLHAKAVADHPQIKVLDVEARLGTRYTVDTLTLLACRFPQTRFVWLMGADNLIQFHRWKRWRDIAALMPLAIIDRPGATHQAPRSKAALALSHFQQPEHGASALAGKSPPAWVFVHGQRSSLSSTQLRLSKSGQASDF